MEILHNLPLDLKREVMKYTFQPPHYFAFTTGLIPIRDWQLNIQDEWITIKHEEMTLDEEWLAFQEGYLTD